MADAPSKLSITTLGHTGVVIDPDPIEPSVPDDALLNAQNATHDPKAAHAGAVRKRPGLIQFNPTFAGGVILGGIMMPVAETGGAPASGGGAFLGTGDSTDGTSIGTGNMTGAPGATFDGGAIATSPAGAGAFTGTTLFGGARLIAIGLDDNGGSNNDGGRAWYLTSKNFNDTAIKSTTPLGPCTVYSFPTYTTPFVNGCQGQASCVGLDGRLYYAATHGNQATGGDVNGTLPIYVTNGGSASLLATIPKNTYSQAVATGTTVRAGVMGMHAGYDGFIYIAVKDKYTGQDSAGSCGRIFRLRPTTGDLVEWSTGAPGTPPPVFTTGIPYSVNYFQGYLYFGVHSGVIDTTASVFASDGTQAIQDNSFNSDTLISTMVQFNGRLFLGTGVNKSVVTLASLFSRAPANAPGSGGWGGHVFDAARTGSGTNGNSYVSMVVYNSTTMFVSWHAPSTKSIIYKVTANAPGDPTSTSFTFTSSFDSGAGQTAPLNLYLDQGTLYAIADGDSGAAAIAWVSTDGGANWVDKSSKFGALGTASFATSHFFAMNQ